MMGAADAQPEMFPAVRLEDLIRIRARHAVPGTWGQAFI